MIADRPNYAFERVDIADGQAVAELFARVQPDLVVHFAAESHVDRSLLDPDVFVAFSYPPETLAITDAAQVQSFTPRRSNSKKARHGSADSTDEGSRGAGTEDQTRPIVGHR